MTTCAAVICAVLYLFGAIPFTKGSFYNSGVFVHPQIYASVQATGNVSSVVVFREQANLSELGSNEGLTRGRKRTLVRNLLQTFAAKKQKNVRGYLNKEHLPHHSFWIANVVTISSLTMQHIKGLVDCCSVDIKSILPSNGFKKVSARKDISITVPAVAETTTNNNNKSGLEWNVQLVHADKCWDTGVNGSGVVVATLDGGVRYTHDALVGGYRGNNHNGTFTHDYNWNDWAYKNAVPLDSDGHGTNVQGIAVGSKESGVGIAPGAQWISGKIFNYAGYSDTAWTLGGAQWVMCPSPVNKPGEEENCSLGADVVSCSWGEDDATESYLKAIVAAWLKADMVPVFAVGNGGPECSTSVSPSDYEGVVGVGASDKNDDILGYSSRGPAKINSTSVSKSIKNQTLISKDPLPYTKLAPAIVAPGFDIQGPSCDSDSAYEGLSGTSQAAPHVAGAAALLLSAYPKLSPAQVLNALYAGASQKTLKDPDTGKDDCGGVPWNTFPNYIYGWGRLDCYAALKKAELFGM